MATPRISRAARTLLAMLTATAMYGCEEKKSPSSPAVAAGDLPNQGQRAANHADDALKNIGTADLAKIKDMAEKFAIEATGMTKQLSGIFDEAAARSNQESIARAVESVTQYKTLVHNDFVAAFK